jgi:hypothetical protein
VGQLRKRKLPTIRTCALHSLSESGLLRVKLGDHFTKFLGNQQRRGERHERSIFGRPGLRVASVPPKAAEFDVRFEGNRIADPIESFNDIG